MFVKEFQYEDTKDAKFINYIWIRNLLMICGHGNSNILEKPYNKLYIVYLLGLITCFLGNAIYAVKEYLSGARSVPTLTAILFITTQYIFYLLISLCLSILKSDFTVLKIDQYDAKAGFKPSPKDHTACLVVVGIIFSFTFTREIQYQIRTNVYDDERYNSSVHIFFIHLVFLLSDVGQVINVLTVEMFWTRTKFARLILEKKLTEDIDSSVKIKKIKEIMQFLKDCSNVIKPVENVTNLKMFVSLTVSFTYTILIFTKYKDILTPTVAFTVHVYIYLCYTLLLPCATSIVYELLASELDKMKMMIVKEYAFSTDEETRSSFSDILLAWRIRNYRRTLWRVIPLDITLLFNFISLVITYSIVVAQFRKLM